MLLLFTVFSIWIDRFKVPDDKGVNFVTNSGVWVLSLRNYDGKIDVLRTNSHPTHFTHPKQPTRHYSGNIKFIFERDQILIYLVHEKNKMLEFFYNSGVALETGPLVHFILLVAIPRVAVCQIYNNGITSYHIAVYYC